MHEGGCCEGWGVVEATKSGVKATQSAFSASHTKRTSENERGGGGSRAGGVGVGVGVGGKAQWKP